MPVYYFFVPGPYSEGTLKYHSFVPYGPVGNSCCFNFSGGSGLNHVVMGLPKLAKESPVTS